MKNRKINLAVLFLLTSGNLVFSQETKKDSAKTKSEKNIEGVILKGNTNKRSETAILGELRKAIIQKQAIGSEEISRKGISNVQQGLIKITGINSVEGKGIFVRGLEERYTYLLINGLGSPSNNPFQKIIALKQFPTDVVGKLNIYKTFTSDLYGDFAGATFDIETLVPEKSFSKIEFSIGYNTQNTLRDNFKISEGANSIRGYIGLNSQNRALPSIVRNAVPSNYEFSKEESINSFKDSWNVDNVKTLPNTSISYITSQKFNLGEGKLGMLFSINHANKYEYKDGYKNQFIINNSEINYNNNLNRKQYAYELESSALLGLNYKKRNLDLFFNAIYLQNSLNRIADFRGYRNLEVQNPRFIRVNQQDISRFLDLQLLGNLKIGERQNVRVGGSWVSNDFQQPDRKIFDAAPENENFSGNVSSGGNNLLRQYLNVDGKNYASAFAEYSVFLGNKDTRKYFPIKLTVGYNGFADIRSTTYRYIFSANRDFNLKDMFVNYDHPQEVFDQTISQGGYVYKEGSTSEYKNNMYQFVNSGYINLDYKPNDSWDILLGGRIEHNLNVTRYKTPSQLFTDRFLSLNRSQYFILPTLSVKKEITDKSNIRFTATKTITRPILIESMPIEYINPENETVLGQAGIKNSENYNLDLKYEIFPTNKEMYAVNFFAKRINNAIEKFLIASGNSNGQTITFFNAQKADIAGVELEGIFDLERIAKQLSNFTLGFNTTLMYSDVERSEDQKLQESDNQKKIKRRLQGAAPWTINADLKYDYKNSKNLSDVISLVYNVTGSKIYSVGSAGMDHIYERPFHQLDFIYSKDISKNWNLKLSVLNLLNDEYMNEMGLVNDAPVLSANRIYENYRKGINFNFTVGYTF